jgi:hypothetical protein
MATIYHDAEDFYNLKSEANVLLLSVQLGQEMNGGYLIFNGDKLIGANMQATITKEEFKDTWLTLSVVIKDNSEKVNWASVLFTLQEDSQIPKNFGPYRRKMEANLDTCCFTIKIKIKKE